MGLFVPIKNNSIGSEKLKGDAVPIGVGQTWQNVTGSRATATTYYNTTEKPILVSITSITGGGSQYSLTINGIAVSAPVQAAGVSSPMVGLVPPNGSYRVASAGITVWAELR
ncbi:MAG: hypothetical protein PHO76_02570 [Methylotenera sp.]|nr:hypothetical protein [Methylotenera sp.]MDD4927227.1 hypothetical protein [Methylotenera sp.]